MPISKLLQSQNRLRERAASKTIMSDLTANKFIKRINALQTGDTELRSVRMGEIFKLGKEFQQMPVKEIEARRLSARVRAQ